MIRVIEATPGSGKTCLVVEWLLGEIDRGFYKQYFANIANLTVSGVRPLPKDCDWRTLNPDKKDLGPILVIVDEAQYVDAFMKENRSVKNSIGKDLSTHRHYGIDFWIISQSSKLLNDYVLANAGEHVYLYRARKRKSVKVYWWSSIQKSLNKSTFKGADDEKTWRLNPNMFAYYKSTANVTDGQTRKSSKLNSILFTFFLVCCVLGYIMFNGAGAFVQMYNGQPQAIADTLEVPTVVEVEPLPVEPYVPEPLPVEPYVVDDKQDVVRRDIAVDVPVYAGGAAIGDKCIAVDQYGKVLAMPYDECVERLSFTK